MLTQQAPPSSLDRVRARVAALRQAGSVQDEVHQQTLMRGAANSANAFSAFQQDLAVEAARKRAAAMAKAASTTAPSGGSGGFTASGQFDESGFDVGFGTALRRFIADSGGKIKITSGRRTRAEQAALYAKKPKLAAPPGRSKHEYGLAADLAYADAATRAWAHANAARYGLRFPMAHEPWHIEPARR